MKLLKAILSNLHRFVLWALVSVIFWSWIFTFVTDTKPEKKVVVFVSAYALEDTELAAVLEEHLPDGIQMIKVHPFSYAMFDDSGLKQADLFIVKGSEIYDWRDSFTEDRILIWDGRAQTGAAADYITYWVPGAPKENYYLLYGAESIHTGEVDDAAFRVAEEILKLTETEETP